MPLEHSYKGKVCCGFFVGGFFVGGFVGGSFVGGFV
jgi:hypothetical protein